MNTEKQKISTSRLTYIILRLICFLVISLILNLICLFKFVESSMQISKIGAENVQLQTEIEYYKKYSNQLEIDIDN